MGSASPPPLSALSTEISAQTQPSHALSSSSGDHLSQNPDIDANSASKSPHTALALQVQHNLQYQHNWAHLRLHTHSPEAPYRALPRPLLSGLPPTRLYVHPDQQADEIAQQKAKQARSTAAQPDTEEPESGEPAIEQEWVLPTHLREKWSLKQFAEVFDGLDEASPGASHSGPAPLESRTEPAVATTSSATGSAKQSERTKKRLLLAMVSDDSTINYYIMHDGIVKPRQN